MKILITGANGQVGQALIKKAQEQNVDAIVYTKENLDITSPSMVRATIQRHHPDVVINAAAYTNVEHAEDEPELVKKINVDGVAYLADTCTNLDIPLIHISTDYVFDGKKQTPYQENDNTVPLSVYGASKLAGEQAITEKMRRYIILRTSWVFSATGNNFVKTMLRLFHEREHVNVVNDQSGAPTSANAIANALLIIAQRVTQNDFSDWGIYHFSGAPITTWYDFASNIRNLCLPERLRLQKLNPIKTSEFPTKATRPQHTAFNLEKIKKVFNIDPCDWQQDLIHAAQQIQQENSL